MTPEKRAIETQILHNKMVDYWYEVDINGGIGVSSHYTEDGIFEGGGDPMIGREAIEGFYAWRLGRGMRTSRHVITNFRAEFHDDDRCTTYCVMMLYAADGPPILPSLPPIMVTDLIDECVRGEDGQWLYKKRSFVALFQGGPAATVPPAHLTTKQA